MTAKGFRWKQCVYICTDGTKLMVGKTRGFISHAKTTTPECTSSHCIIHCHAIAVMTPNALETLLDEAVKTVNCIK
jgi:K+-transporting ATPase A subunit